MIYAAILKEFFGFVETKYGIRIESTPLHAAEILNQESFLSIIVQLEF